MFAEAATWNQYLQEVGKAQFPLQILTAFNLNQPEDVQFPCKWHTTVQRQIDCAPDMRAYLHK